MGMASAQSEEWVVFCWLRFFSGTHWIEEQVPNRGMCKGMGKGEAEEVGENESRKQGNTILPEAESLSSDQL